MAPINPKKHLTNLNKGNKLERKKRREKSILKAVVNYKNEVADEATEEKTNEDVLSSILDATGGVSITKAPPYTISIAVPGSILDNAQTLDLKTYLAGRIARASGIYCVDEVIVFDDTGSQSNMALHKPGVNSCEQLARFLQYIECPQYLRKYLFPLHNDLKFVGLMCPLDAPHHLLANDEFPFREGVVTPKLGKVSYVNVGLMKDVQVDRALEPGTRVTVKLKPQKEGSKKRYGEVVPPSQPREITGVYWGYLVRIAASLSEVFTNGPYREGYDLTIGTSDKGQSISDCADTEFRGFKHILIVFGGLQGLEAALENDESLNIDNVSLLFDKYLNTCPTQGARTIRTEEAVIISLALITQNVINHRKSIT